jgi:hypothetical protein
MPATNRKEGAFDGLRPTGRRYSIGGTALKFEWDAA